MDGLGEQGANPPFKMAWRFSNRTDGSDGTHGTDKIQSERSRFSTRADNPTGIPVFSSISLQSNRPDFEVVDLDGAVVDGAGDVEAESGDGRKIGRGGQGLAHLDCRWVESVPFPEVENKSHAVPFHEGFGVKRFC